MVGTMNLDNLTMFCDMSLIFASIVCFISAICETICKIPDPNGPLAVIASKTYLVIEMFSSLLLKICDKAFVLYYHHKIDRELEKYNRRPLPGPKVDGMFGFLYKIEPNFHKQLQFMSIEYGSIFQLRMGSQNVVIISDAEVVKDVYRQPVFDARPDTDFTKLLGGYGVINSSGSEWDRQRNILHRVMRRTGMRRPFVSTLPAIENIDVEVATFLDTLEAVKEDPIIVRKYLIRSISSIIGRSLMSVCSDGTNEEFDRIIFLIQDGFKVVNELYELSYLSTAKFYLRNVSAYLRLKSNLRETNAYFRRIVQEHKETFDQNHLRDYVDNLILEQKQNIGTKNEIPDEQIMQVMADVFSAGLEPIESLLEWSFLFLAKYPSIQERIYEDIVQVVGINRDPESSDTTKMTFLQATIYEILRMSNIIPLGNPHAAKEDAVINGYHVPKGSHIMPNLYAIHMNGHHYEQPDIFKPERFIVKDKIYMPPNYLPFSSGRRKCIGETMAILEACLYVARVIKRFKIYRLPGKTLSIDETELSISLKPKPFNIIIKNRIHPANWKPQYGKC